MQIKKQDFFSPQKCQKKKENSSWRQSFRYPSKMWLLSRNSGERILPILVSCPSIGHKTSRTCGQDKQAVTMVTARDPKRYRIISSALFKEEGKHSHVQFGRCARKYRIFPLQRRHDGGCVHSFHIHFISTAEGGLKVVWHDQIRFFLCFLFFLSFFLSHYTHITNPAGPLESGNPGDPGLLPVCIDNTAWAACRRTICSPRGKCVKNNGWR